MAPGLEQQNPQQATSRAVEAPRRRIGLAVFLARASICWEEIYPAILAAAAPAYIVAVTGLFGWWRGAPYLLHAAGLALAVVAAILLAARMIRSAAWPSRADALARLEADGAVRHEALQALEDRPFGDAASAELWRAHLEDAARRARTARLKGPRSVGDRADPFGWRYVALSLFALAAALAGNDRSERLAGAFQPSDPRYANTGVGDLWIEPPAYTGKAPIYLLRASDRLAGVRPGVAAPAGSIVIAQVGARSGLRLSLKTQSGTVRAKREAGRISSQRATLLLTTDGEIRLSGGGREGRWPVAALPDGPPQTAFLTPPDIAENGSLTFTAKTADDYGIVSASLRIRLVPDQQRQVDAPAFDAAVAEQSRLVPLDRLVGTASVQKLALDLEADPWAGLEVTGAIVVTDGAGQVGESAVASFRMPTRRFFNPLARSIVEQRQTLAVAPLEWRRAEWALSGLTLGPELFFEKPKDYLLLRTAMWRLANRAGSRTDDTVADFWPLALQLEDEALELARRRLEAAQEALRAALESGAGDAELERLTEELRSAMRDFVQALAQSGQPGDPGEEGGESLNAGDLDEMLDAVRDLAKSGAQNAARQALSDLESILNNLRLSAGRGEGSGQRGGEQAGAGGEEGGGPAGAAGDLIGRQRDLANRSFERGQSPGAAGDDLAGEQGELADELSRLLESLDAERGEGNPDPNGVAAQALGEAARDMSQAGEALRGDDFAAANDAMERAIGNLREGAEALAEQAQQAARSARSGEGERGAGRDPLGRPTGDISGDGVDVPGEADAQRAREFIEALRKRLSESGRTQEEIEYLERLLNRF